MRSKICLTRRYVGGGRTLYKFFGRGVSKMGGMYATTRRYDEEERTYRPFLKLLDQKILYRVLSTTYVATRSPPAYPMLIYVTLS